MKMLERVLSHEPKKFAEYEQARAQLATLTASLTSLESGLRPVDPTPPSSAPSTDGKENEKPKPDEDSDTSAIAPLVLRARSKPCGVSREQWIQTEIQRAKLERGWTEDPEFVVVLERIGGQ